MPILHFPVEEFTRRQRAACASMVGQGLDGLILFRQESMYYLTGYDTSGYSMFQAMYLGADGRIALLTRPIDQIQAQQTSIIEDIRIWRDSAHADPGRELRAMLEDLGARGKRLGVEYHAYGLTGQRAKMVDAALDGFCRLIDASDLVRLLRLVKSPAELVYVRKAGALCDRIFEVSRQHCRPGASVKAIHGAMIAELMASGGDPTASRWPIGAGPAAFFGRYVTGENIVGESDQVVFEPGAAYRHYHACMMYNIITGRPTERHIAMNRVCAEAIDACQEALRPGRTVGEIFDVHRRTYERAGFGHAVLSACGYTMGAMYPPTWMDWPMIWADNPQIIEAGMVFFLHMIIFDKAAGASMCIGETAIVHEASCERVNRTPREPIVVS
ncbi:MAG TPA: Xaa-Pro peptidase family protein [Stellaceae bacterium]|nr:Xaa-Pro peptidase family protein [Stellaceae bacterium]